MILADTSVWIEHLFRSEPILKERLQGGEIVMHPFVVGEIALGRMKRRAQILRDLADVPAIPPASSDEVLRLIERWDLAAAGVGYVDVHLLASALMTPHVTIWTFDKRLADVAVRLGVGEALH